MADICVGLDRSGRVLVGHERSHRSTTVLVIYSDLPQFFYLYDNPSTVVTILTLWPEPYNEVLLYSPESPLNQRSYRSKSIIVKFPTKTSTKLILWDATTPLQTASWKIDKISQNTGVWKYCAQLVLLDPSDSGWTRNFILFPREQACKDSAYEMIRKYLRIILNILKLHV